MSLSKGFLTSLGVSLVVLTAPWIAHEARADVRFDEVNGYFPSGYAATYSLFDGSIASLNAAGSLLEIGSTRPCAGVGQALISSIGPLHESKLARSRPFLPGLVDAPAAVDLADTLEPTFVVLGNRTRDSLIRSEVAVYTGWPPQMQSRRDTDSAVGDAKSVAVTRYVDPTHFDILVVNNGLSLRHVDGADITTVWAFAMPYATRVALLPVATPNLQRAIVMSRDEVRAVDVASGDVVWTGTSGGVDLQTGTLGPAETPVVLVSGPFAGVTAYRTNPLSVLWQRTDLPAVSALIGDFNLDGRNEVLVATYLGRLQRLGDDGSNSGTAVSLPGITNSYNFEMKLTQARVSGIAAPQIIVVAEELYTASSHVSGTYVFSTNLQTQLGFEPRQTGVCNAVRVGDVDGDGHDEIVTLGRTAGDQGPFYSSVRVVAAESGTEQWLRSLPGNTSNDDYADFDIGNLGHGAERDIVLAGSVDGGTGPAIALSVLNPANQTVTIRAVRTLPGANHVAAVRIVPGPGPVRSILIAGSDFASTTLHLVNAGNMQVAWSSGAIAPAADGGSLELAQFGSDPALHAILAVPYNGVYSYNLTSHSLDYSIAIAGNVAVGTLLTVANGPTRFVYQELVAGKSDLVVIDAATGAEVDRLPLMPQIIAMAGDPTDAQRLFVRTPDRVYAIRLDERRIEGVSEDIAQAPPTGRSLTVRVHDDGETVYAGTAVGVSAFHLTSTESPIFRSGFETF